MALYFVMLKELPFMVCKCCRIDFSESVSTLKVVILQLIKIGLVLFLSGYVAYDIVLFYFLPIDGAFEDAANHFISIYQTTIIFFTALAAYFIVKKRSASPIHIFTKALDSIFDDKDDNEANEDYKVLGISRDSWGKWTRKKRDLEVAKSLVKKLTDWET